MKRTSHRTRHPESRAGYEYTYAAALPVRDETVLRVPAPLYAERRRRNTRSGRRALTCRQQAVFFLRWLLDGTRMSQLVADNQISTSTGYERLHETTKVLASHAPSLHGALLVAKAAGYDYVLLDGTLIETDRVSTPGPTPRVDLWWSAKHREPRRQRPGRVRPGQLATMDLAGAAGPGTRHHLPTHPSRPARHPHRRPRTAAHQSVPARAPSRRRASPPQLPAPATTAASPGQPSSVYSRSQKSLLTVPIPPALKSGESGQKHRSRDSPAVWAVGRSLSRRPSATPS